MAQAAVSQQSDAPKVAVFTTVGCPYCKKAKGILQEENITYQEIDVSSGIKLRRELRSITGQKTVPQARSCHALIRHLSWQLVCVCSSYTCHADFLWRKAYWRC